MEAETFVDGFWILSFFHCPFVIFLVLPLYAQQGGMVLATYKQVAVIKVHIDVNNFLRYDLEISRNPAKSSRAGVPKVCSAASWCAVESEEWHSEAILFTTLRNLNLSVRTYLRARKQLILCSNK